VLPNLDTLTLAGTRVTDRGLAHLKRLTKLSSLNLSGTQVTDTGVKKLMQALPSLRIIR
jgi:Leucine-rich repeat (LRR) protein